MKCANCGKDNDASNRYCLHCGHEIKQVAQTKKKETFKQMITISSYTFLAGGGLTTLGWLLPWFSFGNLLSQVLNFFDIGISSRLFGSGAGSGIQLSLLSLVTTIAALSDTDTAIFGLIPLLVFVLLVSIPVYGGLNIKKGLVILDIKNSLESDQNVLEEILLKIRNRSKSILIVLLIIFVGLSITGVGVALLTTGFYLTALGAVITYFDSRITASKIKALLSEEANAQKV